MNFGLASDDVIRQTSDLFGVLSDPTRVKIIYLLSREELCVGDIAGLVGVSESAVSHQLRVLRNLGIVNYRREGKMSFYALRDEHIEKILEQSMDHVKE
ncbi:MAG: helix-turn-helix transcriptional regulator [Actinobacteria bacterium]|nr:helix-turn-helix transcriptional regulator [Actinomycetota bacterium]